VTSLGLVIAALGLVAANGFFVATEFALIAARRSRLEVIAGDGSALARSALAAMSDLPRQIAGAQLGITLASLALGLLGEPAVADLIEPLLGGLPEGVTHALAFALALLIVVVLHLVLGEMVPKNVAIAGPERTLTLLATPHRLFVAVLAPLIWLLNGMARVGVRLFGARMVDELGSAHTAQELVTLLDASRGHGTIDAFAHQLLSGALDLGARPGAEIMVPRDEVVWAPVDSSISDLVRLASESGHSRLPLGGERGVDGLVGFVHAKDLIQLDAAAGGEPLERRYVRRMLVVTPDRTLEELLRWMRRDRVHVALLRAPDGTTAGIVTLEDVLEELVGEIVDETDRLRATPR
jgi:CBS domain containing-hemolysin-like protein